MDTEGHIGGYVVNGSGVGAGDSASGGVSLTVSNAKNICNLRGGFGNANIGGGDGVGVEGNGFVGKGSDGTVIGVGVTVGAGVGGGGSVGGTNTNVIPIR